MTELLADVAIYRGIERWLIVLGGLVFAYLGYKLFLYGVDQGNGKLEAENQFFKFTFSGSGPGLFFMAFGALVLMTNVFSAVEYEKTARPADSSPVSALAGDAQETTTERVRFASGGKGGACNDIRLSTNNGNVAAALEAYALVNETPAGIEIGALAGVLKDAVTDEETLRPLLLTIEDVICKLEP